MDEEERPHSSRKTVSKLQREADHQSARTKPAASGRGRSKRATPLVPGKAGLATKGLDGAAASNKTELDTDKLHSILRGYGEYPAKYR